MNEYAFLMIFMIRYHLKNVSVQGLTSLIIWQPCSVIQDNIFFFTDSDRAVQFFCYEFVNHQKLPDQKFTTRFIFLVIIGNEIYPRNYHLAL